MTFSCRKYSSNTNSDVPRAQDDVNDVVPFSGSTSDVVRLKALYSNRETAPLASGNAPLHRRSASGTRQSPAGHLRRRRPARQLLHWVEPVIEELRRHGSGSPPHSRADQHDTRVNTAMSSARQPESDSRPASRRSLRSSSPRRTGIRSTTTPMPPRNDRGTMVHRERTDLRRVIGPLGHLPAPGVSQTRATGRCARTLCRGTQ